MSDTRTAQEFIDGFRADTGSALFDSPVFSEELELNLVAGIAELIRQQRELCASAISELETVDVPHGAGNNAGVVRLADIDDVVTVVMAAGVDPTCKTCGHLKIDMNFDCPQCAPF